MTFIVVKDSEKYRFDHHDERALDVFSIRSILGGAHIFEDGDAAISTTVTH